eukprot:15438288-Alexandrium_andersonii.AAC.1
MATDRGKTIKIYQVGVALVTLLRHDPDRQIRYLMDTAGWASASAILETDTMQKFGPLSDQDFR